MLEQVDHDILLVLQQHALRRAPAQQALDTRKKVEGPLRPVAADARDPAEHVEHAVAALLVGAGAIGEKFLRPF